ncbi:DUF3515 domain-containing protein [Nocardioides sp. Soil805]|uniref:DUF3515 domain-containing protein n=1 Tax=Nocardioides sp. Soil805 TaxID=1736416 RepID=UPI00138ECD83|nr:DUF3515 domain-containing protein [Nocardioides sp. Soil805]
MASAAGCSDQPDLRDLSGGEASACADLVDALPDTLAGVAMTDSDERTAAWGEIELTCGVDRPEEYDEYAPCLEIRNVGWFVPDAELEDLGGDATATALTHTPYVALHVPAAERDAGVDQMLTELAQPVRSELEPTEPCK